MNEKLYDKPRWRFWCIALFLLIAFSVIAFKQIVSHHILKNRPQIEALLKTNIGFPVSFEDIDVGLFSLSLREIIVSDIGNPVPFFSIRQIKFFPKWWDWLVDQKISFYKIILKDPKCLARFDSKTGVTLLGLQGETISSSIDYAGLRAFLKTQKQLLIQGGQIQWHFDDQTLHQDWNGYLKWVGSQKIDWRLEIDQQISIAGGVPFESQMHIAVAPHQQVFVDATLGPTKFHAELEAILDQWQVNAQLHASKVELQALHNYYQPKDTDSKLLQWLSTALKTGFISKMALNIKGPLQAPKLAGSLDYEGVDLNYQSPWPAIEGAKGFIQFQPEAIQIQVNEGSIHGAPLQNATALIEYATFSKPACVFVEGLVSSRLEEGMAFLVQSPLRDSVTKPLEGLALKGAMQLDLKLQIPLENQPKVRVLGVLSMDDATLKTDLGIPVHELKADFYFNESSFKAKDFRCRVWDQNLHADLSVDWPLHHLQLVLYPDAGGDKIPLKKSWSLETTVGTGAGDFNEWSINGGPLAGKIRLESLNNKKNRLIVTLSRCSIDRHFFKTVQSHFSDTMPTIDFLLETKSFEYDHRLIGELSLALISKDYGYEIQDFSLQNPFFNVQATGFWRVVNGGENTHLQGELMTTNLRKTVSSLGYESIIREAHGTIQYKLEWSGSPWTLALNQVNGEIDLKLDKGRVMGVDPGLGRVMGLLNLESIKRRLRLDFSDLFKKGFVFDILHGKCQLNRGVLRTESLVIDGPSSKIHLSGEANLSSRAIDLNMRVSPHIGSGLPLAAAVAAGNPALGAGMWLVNKLTGSKFSRMTDQQYQVGGTWDAPVIKNNSAATSDAKNISNK